MGLFRKKPKSEKLGPKEYEKLGRDFENILITDYIQVLHSTPRQIWSSFTRGVFAGLGGVIGATLGVAILLVLLSYLGTHLPVVGPYFKAASDVLQKARN